MKYRLAVVTSHVIQYQGPLFRQLAANQEIDLTVLFCSRIGSEPYHDWDLGVEVKWDLDLLEGYRHVFLRNVSPVARGGFWNRINPGIVTALIRGRYDAVLVMGWGSPTAWLAFATCRALGVPFYLSGDNSFVVDRPTLKGRVRRVVLRALFSRTAGFMLMGTMNGDFYKHFGADPQRFYLMPYAIDNQRFFERSRMTEGERAQAKEGLRIAPDHTVILYSGKLIAKKCPLDLLQAFERMRFRERSSLLFMGDGVEREALERYARDRGITCVHFAGFVNQRRMPTLYGASDVFVLPSSYDPRGTVVNEAMACGLPVIVTDKVGVWGEGDIVRHGQNGFVFTVGDIDGLAVILDDLVADPAMRARMGARSLEIIGSWNYDADVRGLLEALHATARSRSSSRLVPSQQAG